MLKRKLAAAIAAALLAPAMASAADQVGVPAGDLSVIFEFEPSRLTREEVQRALTYPIGAADGWRFVGGEAGWIAEGARLNYVQGQLVHADECLFDPSKSGSARDTGPAAPDLYRGA
jgi:hypothetical protein